MPLDAPVNMMTLGPAILLLFVRDLEESIFDGCIAFDTEYRRAIYCNQNYRRYRPTSWQISCSTADFKCSIALAHFICFTFLVSISLTMATVILGAGIIGVSTAFYLCQDDSIDPSTIHLVEATPTFFSSASGYAGGFLAEDWFSEAAAALGELSFAEHKRVAEEYGGKQKWGYSRSTGTTYAPAKQALKGSRKNVDVWFREGSSRVDAAPEGVSTFVGKEIDPRAPAWLTRTYGDTLDFVSEEESTAQV